MAKQKPGMRDRRPKAQRPVGPKPAATTAVAAALIKAKVKKSAKA
jgi:hypothetical protein